MRWTLPLLILCVNFFLVFPVVKVFSQEGSGSAIPSTNTPSPDPVFATPVPTPVTPEPIQQNVLQTPSPIPIPPTIVPDVIIIPLPTSSPVSSSTPRPTLPLYFEITRTPPPSPTPILPSNLETGGGVLSNNRSYRMLVVPTLSFVTQTNADEFYKDQALPKRTADLLVLISLGLIILGTVLYFEQTIISNISKLRERKEYVQYIGR